jgi:membrane associated rhomboid family serine protease
LNKKANIEPVYILIGFLAIIYVVEVVFSKNLTPSPAQLSSLGATSSLLASQDEVFWLRIFTALFLHGSLMHLMGNSIGLLIGFPTLERLIGKWWGLVIFLFSGAVGSIFSILSHKMNVVSVGASGGVIGVFAAALIFVNTKVIKEYRKNLNILFLQAMLPSLIPLMPRVDYAAHIGGAVGGVITALLILIFWPNDKQHPQGELLAQACVFSFALLSLLACYLTIVFF